MFAGIALGLAAVALFESVYFAVAVLVYMTASSRYGYRTFTCPCCHRSIYKNSVNEANIFISRIPERCPYCGCDYDAEIKK